MPEYIKVSQPLMRIRFNADLQNSRVGSWQECLRDARADARTMEFEKGIEKCLKFLHQYILPPERFSDQSKVIDNTKVFFACGGNSSRWDGFLDIPKQLVDTGDGLPLIQRTINQFDSRFKDCDFNLLIKADEEHYFKQVIGAKRIHRHDSLNRTVGIEVLTHASKSIPEEYNILWVYGDVYFSDLAINVITTSIASSPSIPCFFGRKTKNDQYGNSGGEIFVVYIPGTFRSQVLDYYRFLKRLYVGTPLHKCSSWELVSFASITFNDNNLILPSAQLIDNDAGKTYNLIAEIRENKKFHPKLWVDIDDETEDFDFPYEYIERIYRTVVLVGTTLDSRK